MEYIGKSVIRKEAFEKVTGKAKYTDDFQETGTLHAKMLTSPYAHADIVSMDFSEAWKIPGVRAILGDEPFPLAGEEIKDRSPIAYKRVRYHGEPVAVVVAENPITAKKAADAIKVSYKPLPVVNSPVRPFKRMRHSSMNMRTAMRRQKVYSRFRRQISQTWIRLEKEILKTGLGKVM